MKTNTKKVRIFYPFFPYPPSEGSFYVVFDQIRSFAREGYEVELVCWKDQASDIQAKLSKSYLEALPSNLKWVVLSPCSKEGRLERFFRVGFSLVSNLSSPEFYYYPPGLKVPQASSVDLEIYNYTFAYSWLSQMEKAQTKRVIVFHNLESELFRDRALGAKSKVVRWIHQQNEKKLFQHENEIGKFVDELWFISPEDHRNYLSRGEALAIDPSKKKIRLVPPGFTQEFYSNRIKKFKSREHHKQVAYLEPQIGFIGNMEFLPNHLSAEWLIQQLAPCLRDRGFQGKLIIAGKGMSEVLKKQAELFPFIQCEGYITDLEEYWASLDFSLVPHLNGSGVRIKLLESLASGVPTLATSGAVSRIPQGLTKSKLLFCSDDPQEWCNWIIGREKDQRRRESLSSLPFLREIDSQEIYSFLRVSPY